MCLFGVVMNKLLVVFSAGCLGGLANSLAVWWFGDNGIMALLNVSIAPSLSAAWLYPRIVWGGIWGLVFLVPLLNKRLILKASLLSLLPSAVQLFVVFPLKAGKGMAGLDLGVYTPIFVVFFNWIWAVVTVYAIKFSRKNSYRRNW